MKCTGNVFFFFFRSWEINVYERKFFLKVPYKYLALPGRLVAQREIFILKKINEEYHLITHVANAGGLYALVSRQASTFRKTDKAITSCF